MAEKGSLSPEERERYDRQIIIPNFGLEGQEKLKKATVLVVGAGGLGCPVSTYLAAAGAGEIRIVDFDDVALSNLNRQVLHWQENLGQSKALSASGKLARLNPHSVIKPLNEALTEENIGRILSGVDVVVDALDNFETRQLLNQGAVANSVPFIYGGVNGLMGMVTTIVPSKTPCLSCLFPHTAPKEIFPVLGTTPAVIGAIQATEVIKLIVGLGRPLTGRLLVYDGLEMSFSTVNVERDPSCPVCGSVDS